MPPYFASLFARAPDGAHRPLRRRLAPLVLLGGLLAFGKLAHEEVPREQEVRFVLTDAQAGAQSVRVTYVEGGEVLTGIERHFPTGAPSEFSHLPSLRPGRYELDIAVTGQDGRITSYSRKIEVPGEGAFRIVLGESP